MYLPVGTYEITSITVPDGLSVTGSGMGTTWLKGKVVYGSDSSFSDLKIGDAGVSAIVNGNGADSTTFTRCHFRGGGGAWGNLAVVNFGDSSGGPGCSFITLKDCEIERNLGTENSSFSNGYNDISLYSQSSTSSVHDITLDGCHVGVSNGVATGSPRMGMECFVAAPDHLPWQNITLRGCVFEATDGTCLDFADQGFAGPMSASGVLVEGCTLKGAGVLASAPWSNIIAVECPSGVVITGNTIYRSYQAALAMSHLHASGPGMVITNNNFDFVTDNGVTPYGYTPISLMGYDNVFTGNTITLNWASRAIDLASCTNNVVTGNIAHLGGRPLFAEWGGGGNVTSPNTVR